MELSKEFQALIDHALVDGKLDKKEREILYRRAEKEGVDKDELDMYINSQLFQSKKGKESIWKMVIYSEKDDKSSSGHFTIRLWHLLAVIVPLAVLIGTAVVRENMKDKTDYAEYLTQYDFEKARIQASKLQCIDDVFEYRCPQTEAYVQIIITETEFLADNLEFDKAISCISEIHSLTLYSKLLEKGKLSKSQDDLSDELIIKVIMKASNHPDVVDKTKMDSYLGLIKNPEEFKRVQKLLKTKK